MMKKHYLTRCPGWFLFVLLLLLCPVGCSVAERSDALTQRSRASFDKNWCFKQYDLGTNDAEMRLQAVSLDDTSWRKLDLPHDWAIEGGFDVDLPNKTGCLPSPGIGWYRKHFTLPASDSDKRIFIEFDGAMSHAKVWLNGQYIGQWPYGYASFCFELTPHMKFGKENILAVRLENPDQSSRWYPGGGIYRHTWLLKTPAVHVAHWGTCVTTPDVSARSAAVKIETEIRNQSGKVSVATVEHEIVRADKPEAIIVTSKPQTLSIDTGQIQTVTDTLAVDTPMLWDIDTPTLYIVRTTVKADGQMPDRYETPFGIRTVEFDAKQGFLLNEKKVYLKGVCLHHDLGPLGAAVHRRGIERQLEILKEMGCNSIRTSHNPPAPELLELCDTMGFVVIDEAFDCWERGKIENDYGTLFKEWHEKDVVSLVRRDRNHPCVILWSSGNEVREQRLTQKGGLKVSSRLTHIFHREDPTRPVTCGFNKPESVKNGMANTVDVYGFNYKPHLYQTFAKLHPNLPFYSSESASCVSSRGEYFFPVDEGKSKGFFNYQVSSYDLYAPGWAMPPDQEFEGQDQNPSCAGEYVWTGFDYIGEPTPYNKDKTIALNFSSESEKSSYQKMLNEMDDKSPSRSSYFGIIDLCGFPKDRFYIYQARWRPELPMAHILPHWNWPERVGEITPVHVYTSGDEAELFLNGKSLGRRKKGDFMYRLRWNDVVYEPGDLKVIAYKDGKKWAENVMKTTDRETQLQLRPDRKMIEADGRDLSYITVKVADKDGLMVPRSNPKISFSIDGPGEIIATGNGNAIDHTSFLSKERKAYNGMCLVIVRSLEGKPGKIRIQATSKGLRSAETMVTSR